MWNLSLFNWPQNLFFCCMNGNCNRTFSYLQIVDEYFIVLPVTIFSRQAGGQKKKLPPPPIWLIEKLGRHADHNRMHKKSRKEPWPTFNRKLKIWGKFNYVCPVKFDGSALKKNKKHFLRSSFVNQALHLRRNFQILWFIFFLAG